MEKEKFKTLINNPILRNQIPERNDVLNIIEHLFDNTDIIMFNKTHIQEYFSKLNPPTNTVASVITNNGVILDLVKKERDIKSQQELYVYANKEKLLLFAKKISI